jgi:membrane glycosyltransferase
MPIYNEDVERVFRGISVIYRSLQRTGQENHFDFFILSDTRDPDLWVREEIAWQETCRSLKACSRFFYRHRAANSRRKSGNIADFCRRWGGNYRYFIVLDADSIMSGEMIVNLVRIMEADASIGILQTNPVPVRSETLLARAQQFAGQMYGQMFAAGLHFWQLGDAQYWGHNAIIRTEPFIKHCCDLPTLPGSPPLGGDIMSHDFVEAAFMRRAGWGVWLAYDMEGSYEDLPPTLLDELGRDRRWSQGNLQHLRLLFTKGLLPAHRFLFFNGAMSYLSSLIWLIFLGLNTAEAIMLGLLERYYFPWLEIHPSAESAWDLEVLRFLLVVTMLLLFLPKLLALFVNLLARRRSSSFGGPVRLVFNMVAEALTSALLAPLRMLAHSRFVLFTLLGDRIEWTPPPRDTLGTSWREGLRFASTGSALTLLWAFLLFLSSPTLLWWFSPIMIPLFLGAPITVFLSKVSIGRNLRLLGLFLTPSESQPTAELRDLAVQQEGRHRACLPGRNGSAGFVAAVMTPAVNDLHREIQRSEPGAAEPLTEGVNLLIEKALKEGPNSLSAPEKMQLLANVSGMQQLHERVRELSDGERTRERGPGGEPSSP